jgi:hypothetical protein
MSAEESIINEFVGGFTYYMDVDDYDTGYVFLLLYVSRN